MIRVWRWPRKVRFDLLAPEASPPLVVRTADETSPRGT